MPYVTLHRIVADDNDGNLGAELDTDNVQETVQKRSNDSSYSFEYVALLENNTRLQVIFLLFIYFIITKRH